MLLLRQSQKFVDKVNGDQSLTVKFYNKKTMLGWDWSEFSAVALCDEGIIFLNREEWCRDKKDEEWQKNILLHEVGHFKDKREPLKGRQSVREYNAQIWAMNRARRLGMKKISRRIRKEFIEWQERKWNSSDRKYRMAYHIAKEKKVL